MVKYNHTVTFWIKGVSPLQIESDKEIILNPTVDCQFVLTSNPDKYCFEGDRSRAIAGLLLGSMFGQANSDTFDVCLKKALEEIRESRKQKFGTGVYLVFLRHGSVNVFSPSHEKELEDFVVCFDGTSKEEIKEISEPSIQAILSALVLAIDNVLGVTKTSDSIVFFREDGKPIYSYTGLVGSATLFVSQPIDKSSVESLSSWYKILVSNAGLERVNRLLLSSLQTGSDALRSFLSAWNALEIFIGKTFGFYENRFFQEISCGAHPKVVPQFFKRIHEVTKDNYPFSNGDFLTVLRQNSENIRSDMRGNKYKLSNEFALIASFLSLENVEEDIKEFMIAKKQRDKLLHGQDVIEADLPVESVRKMTRKYLRLHLSIEQLDETDSFLS